MTAGVLHHILLLLLTTSALGCANFSLTLERCANTADCSDVQDLRCISFDAAGEPRECGTGGLKPCRCYPDLSFHFCTTNADCLDREFCARSSRSGDQFCAGCLTRFDNETNFAVVDASDIDERCPSSFSTTHPPCGHMADFCSATMPCDQDCLCLSATSNYTVRCEMHNAPCRCYFGGERDWDLCSLNTDCFEEREACAWYPTINANICMSCDIIRESHFLLLNDSAKCDALQPPVRDQPRHYVDGRNGRTLDLCERDLQCTGQRRCVQARADDFGDVKRCGRKKDDFCFCRASKLRRCKDGTDCPRGESCVIAPVGAIRRHCASNAFLDTLPRDAYKIVGNFTPSGLEGGKGLNGDACTFDWNCAGGRRCTHVSDEYGGCAGRVDCKCRGLTYPPCEKHGDCDIGELCTKVVDSQTQPFCMSKEVVRQKEYLRRFNDPLAQRTTPTPIPSGSSTRLTEDPCLTDADCTPPRRCFHRDDTNGPSCNADRRFCRCYQPDPAAEQCTSSDDCTPGELCTAVKQALVPEKRCVSALAFDRELSGERRVVGRRPSPSPSPVEDASESLPPEPSSSLSDEVEDEEELVPSAQPTGLALPEETGMVQSTPEATVESSTEPGICVDAALLCDWPFYDLVFPQHRKASVLCDQAGSCATPGHMVTFHDRPMSMRSYCDAHATCSRNVTLVNSPRWDAGLRLRTRTHGLEMTALAARFDTWIEEALLKQLMHWGI